MTEFELSLKLLMIAAWFSAIVWIMPMLFILTKMKKRQATGAAAERRARSDVAIVTSPNRIGAGKE